MDSAPSVIASAVASMVALVVASVLASLEIHRTPVDFDALQQILV